MDTKFGTKGFNKMLLNAVKFKIPPKIIHILIQVLQQKQA